MRENGGLYTLPSAVNKAEELIEFVFCRAQDEVVGAVVVDFAPSEGLFEGGEAGPGVAIWGAFGGDAPEIEVFEAFFVGI